MVTRALTDTEVADQHIGDIDCAGGKSDAGLRSGGWVGAAGSGDLGVETGDGHRICMDVSMGTNVKMCIDMSLDMMDEGRI